MCAVSDYLRHGDGIAHCHRAAERLKHGTVYFAQSLYMHISLPLHYSCYSIFSNCIIDSTLFLLLLYFLLIIIAIYIVTPFLPQLLPYLQFSFLFYVQY